MTPTRHPASGYVQGMNDLVTPFLAVFLSDCMKGGMSEWGGAEELMEGTMLDVEADCYWCLCKMLEGIQDHYTYAQPGIQRTVFRLKELVRWGIGGGGGGRGSGAWSLLVAGRHKCSWSARCALQPVARRTTTAFTTGGSLPHPRTLYLPPPQEAA